MTRVYVVTKNVVHDMVIGYRPKALRPRLDRFPTQSGMPTKGCQASGFYAGAMGIREYQGARF